MSPSNAISPCGRIAAVASFALYALAATGASPASAQTIALVAGDVYPVVGNVIEGGTVLIRNGRIAGIGKNVKWPKGTQVIDCKGKRITPGLIDSMTQIGLVEVSLEASTVDGRPQTDDPIRAAVRVDDAVDLRSPLVGVARRHGVTSVISAPRGGLISGRSSWVDLVGPRSRSIGTAVSGPVAMHVHLGEAGARAVLGSRAAAFSSLREVLEDARVYRGRRSQFQRRALYELSASRLDLAALDSVIRRRMPMIIEAHRASDISAVLRFAREQKISVAIAGAAEGWLVADEIAKARVPVIVDPFANLPSSFQARYARTDNAALMARAGVALAFTTNSSHNVSGLRFAMGQAVRTGVPSDVALAAGTLVPARIFGRGNVHGALRLGRVANVVVWSGDPFEPSSYAEVVIIRGEIQPTESRQTRLAERYIRKLGLIRDAE